METSSQQLSSDDSFSYSWVLNINPPSFDDDAIYRRFSFDDSAADGAFIEINPRVASFRRMSFDFGLSHNSPALVHADQIFSNGLILPLHLVSTPPPREGAGSSSDSSSESSVLSRSLSLDSSRFLLSLSKRYTKQQQQVSFRSAPMDTSSPKKVTSSSSSRRSNGIVMKSSSPLLRSSKKILRRYLCFFMPLFKKVKGLRRVAAAAAAPSTAARSCCSSDYSMEMSSPRDSDALMSSIDWCRFSRTFDMGVERSILDAVLHCKKSIGRDE